MKVKDINTRIEKIDNIMMNLKRLQQLSIETRRDVEAKASLDNTVANITENAVHMLAIYRNLLEQKVNETEVEML